MTHANTAHAVVVDADRGIHVVPVTVPALGPRDVLVRTSYSGVSTGTDKWIMQGRFGWRETPLPLVPGYQRAGVVEALGSEVTDLRVGQEVVATESRPFAEASPVWGAHASLAVTAADEVYDATGVPAARASLFVSGQVGYNAASRILGAAPQRVVVYGDGIIGVSGALAAVARGFEVLLVGLHPERLAGLPALGIATAVHGEGSATAVRDWAPVAVIDTVQNDGAFREYVEALPRAGQVVFSGHAPDGVRSWADMATMQQRELTATFVSGWQRDRIDATLELMRLGAMPLEVLAATPAASTASIERLLQDVVAGVQGPVAAIVDWRDV